MISTYMVATSFASLGEIKKCRLNSLLNSIVGQQFEGYRIENEVYFYQYGKVISEEVNILVMTVGGVSGVEKIEEIL